MNGFPTFSKDMYLPSHLELWFRANTCPSVSPLPAASMLLQCGGPRYTFGGTNLLSSFGCGPNSPSICSCYEAVVLLLLKAMLPPFPPVETSR